MDIRLNRLQGQQGMHDMLNVYMHSVYINNIYVNDSAYLNIN